MDYRTGKPWAGIFGGSRSLAKFCEGRKVQILSLELEEIREDGEKSSLFPVICFGGVNPKPKEQIYWVYSKLYPKLHFVA